MDSIKIMGHLVAGFPDRAGFEAACRGLSEGGVEILEIQIPFSDPTADGPVNTAACEAALRNGFRLHDIFSYIAFAQECGFDEIHLMSYANPVYRFGVAAYTDAMEAAGVTGLIVPDLPIEDEEGFYAGTLKRKVDALPVIVVHMPEERVRMLNAMGMQRCYVSLRQGVTGQATEIEGSELQFLKKINIPRLYAGFGISAARQVAALQGHVYAAVVGSYFTGIISGKKFDYAGIRREVCAGARALKR